MTQADHNDNRPVFQLKGGMVAATVLELNSIHLPRLYRQLSDKVAQAPQLFRGSPLVLGLDKLGDEDGPLDLPAILGLCRELGLQPVAVRAARAADIAATHAAGLPVLPALRNRAEPEPAAPEPAPVYVEAVPEPVAVPAAANASRPSRVITQPVRGGQQIYAEGADLIVLAPVSAGAEIIADGHIHCYGPLRGRALAGARGDTGARIFCQLLEAELVAVAGHYKTAEELRQRPQWAGSACISLNHEALDVAALN